MTPRRGGGKGDLEKARADLTKLVMGREGVAGTAVGERKGAPCLIVYVTGDAGKKGVPSEVRGIPVKVEKSGPFRAG